MTPTMVVGTPLMSTVRPTIDVSPPNLLRQYPVESTATAGSFGSILVARERSSERRRNAEQREQIRAYRCGFDAFGLCA